MCGKRKITSAIIRMHHTLCLPFLRQACICWNAMLEHEEDSIEERCIREIDRTRLGLQVLLWARYLGCTLCMPSWN
jgi:hypothetical protein